MKLVLLEKTRRSLAVYGILWEKGRIDSLVHEMVIIEIRTGNTAVFPGNISGRLAAENLPNGGAGHTAERDGGDIISPCETSLFVVPVGQGENRGMRQSENHPLYMIVEVFMPVLGDEPRVVDNPDFVIEPRKRVEQLSGGQFRRTERLKRQIREVLVDCLMNLVPYAKANVTVIRDHRDCIHLRLQLAHELYGLRNKGRLFENGEVVPFGHLRCGHHRIAIQVPAEQVLDRLGHRVPRIAD
ncbi:MAG: hypothetical protein ACLTZY_01790 [Alistipes indistinctus]